MNEEKVFLNNPLVPFFQGQRAIYRGCHPVGLCLWGEYKRMKMAYDAERVIEIEEKPYVYKRKWQGQGLFA